MGQPWQVACQDWTKLTLRPSLGAQEGRPGQPKGSPAWGLAREVAVAGRRRRESRRHRIAELRGVEIGYFSSQERGRGFESSRSRKAP